MASAPLCVARAQDCLNERVARICSSDGKSYVPVQCRAGELCKAGTCAADPNPACTSDDDACVTATTALRCSTTSKGFEVVDCPLGTTCTGAGLCQGACIVGSSTCNSDGGIAKCLDGKTFTTTACAANERCVSVASDPYNVAACKAAECQPDANGCDFVCGNKANPSLAGQVGYLSFCQETSNGYKWVGVQCTAGKTCSPSAASCGGGYQADCASDCKPGDQRCVNAAGSGGGDSAIQTCGANGTWGATVSTCNANPAAGGKVCFPKSGDPAHVVCGDPACTAATGACDNTGKFHACGSDGLVAATGTTCAAGICVQTGSINGAWQPGICAAQCRTTEERCLGGSSFQACAANGTWAAVQNCPANKDCIPYTTPSGLGAKTCGECAPNTSRCSTVDGNPAGQGSAYLQLCGTDALWAAATACAVGTCKSFGAQDEASCVADCFPNKELCLGDGAQLPGLPYGGTDSHGTCTADGRIPDFTLCDGGTICRKNAGGAALGGVNEFGMVDTRCADAVGAPGNAAVQTCKADSSGWQGIATLVTCNSGTVCVDATTNISFPDAQPLPAQCINEF